MKTKNVKLSVGTISVRGMTAGEAVMASDMRKSIDDMYLKPKKENNVSMKPTFADIKNHAIEAKKITFFIIAQCIIQTENLVNILDGKPLEEYLIMLNVPDVEKIDNAITELSAVSKTIKKNISKS